MGSLAKELTIAQIWAAVSTVALLLLAFGKYIKELRETWPSLVKAWKYVQRKWFADAIFKKDLMDTITAMKKDIADVKAEVKHNGGSSLKDMVKRIENSQADLFRKADFTDLKLEAGYVLGGRMTAIFDKNAECVDVNPVFLKRFGWTKEELIRVGYENMIHEEDRRDFQVKLSRAIATGSKFSEPELRVFDSESQEHKINVTGYPFFSRTTGEVEHYFFTFERI